MDSVPPTVPLLIAAAVLGLVILAAFTGYAHQTLTRARQARKQADEPRNASQAKSPARVRQGASR